MRTFDENGNEVFQVQINTIAPIEHQERARYLSHQFLLSFDGGDPIHAMLPTYLRPIGEETATHVLCSRSAYTHELNNQLQFLSEQTEEWISSEVESNPETIRSKFCTILGSKESLLTSLNLEEV